MFKNHIIICGWNENMPFIIKNLLHKNVSTHKQIVVLADSGYESPFNNSEFKSSEVFFAKGDASKTIDLDRANIKEADIVVIVADSKSSDTDAENILKIHTVTDYCRKLSDDKIRKKEKVHIIAEIRDIRKREIAEKVSANETIILEQIEKKLLVQAVKNPGIYGVIDEILTYNDYNDIYSHKLNAKSKLLNQTFDKLLFELRKHNILLIAINREYNLKENEEIKINSIRSIITNPINDDENNYKIQQGDVLIVLAQNEKTFNNALKLLE